MAYTIIENLYSIEKYILQMRPVLRKDELFSDGTSDYRIPMEPKAGQDVKIRFRTGAHNVDVVFLVHGDEKIAMKVVDSDRKYDYHEATVTMDTDEYVYHFEIVSGLISCYYGRTGVSRDYKPEYDFRIVPDFSTPDWAKGAVMYQIYTDRFCNGDTSNDVVTGEYYYIDKQVQKIDNWNKTPDTMDVANFYGGDLAGVMSKLDYLQNLGVEVIYFNPLFVSASNHKYDTQDYDYIDPHVGVIIEDGGQPLEPG